MSTEQERVVANGQLICECGHSLVDHHGRVCGNIACMELDCRCEDFCYLRMFSWSAMVHPGGSDENRS